MTAIIGYLEKENKKPPKENNNNNKTEVAVNQLAVNLGFKLRLCTTTAINQHDALTLNVQHVTASTCNKYKRGEREKQ